MSPLSSCTPVVVDGWGGAGDGCAATSVAVAAAGAITESLRTALPVYWQSTAADRYTERVTDLLRHCARLTELLETAHQRLVEQSAKVAQVRGAP